MGNNNNRIIINNNPLGSSFRLTELITMKNSEGKLFQIHTLYDNGTTGSLFRPKLQECAVDVKTVEDLTYNVSTINKTTKNLVAKIYSFQVVNFNGENITLEALKDSKQQQKYFPVKLNKIAVTLPKDLIEYFHIPQPVVLHTGPVEFVIG